MEIDELEEIVFKIQEIVANLEDPLKILKQIAGGINHYFFNSLQKSLSRLH